MTPSHPRKADSASTADAQATHAQAKVFTPARDHILGIIFLSAIALLSIGWAPKYLGWLLIIPILGIWWVLKSRTRVSEKGIAISYAFKGSKTIPWEEFSGIGFQRARAFARTKSGKQHSLPGITFNSLPELSKASRGRIPDALTAGREAADEKVVVVHRDGQQVLMSKEEYARHLAKHPELKKDAGHTKK